MRFVEHFAGLRRSLSSALVFCLPLHCLAAPVITNLHQLKTLSRSQAGFGVPLQLKGTVVCYDAGWHQLYLHDGVETLYFNADHFPVQPGLGDVVTIAGTALGGAFTNMTLTVVAKAPLPVPKNLRLSALAAEHSEWIETGGRLLSAENSRGPSFA